MTATTYKNITLLTPGVSTDWGNGLNNGIFTDLDTCLGGTVTKTLSNSDVMLSAAESKAAILQLTGTLSANVQITTVTNGFCFIRNATSGNYLITFTNGTGAVALIPQGMSTAVHIDSVNGVFLAGPRTSTVGMISTFAGTTIPSGWLKANGALTLRASYPALWTYAQASGNIVTDANWVSNKAYGCFSTGDTSTTFRLPDLRGYFITGWADDSSTPADAGRSAGIFQDAALLAHTHTGTTGIESASHTHQSPGADIDNTAVGGGSSRTFFTGSEYAFATGTESTSHTHSFTSNSTGGTRNVPQNVALMVCISYG